MEKTGNTTVQVMVTMEGGLVRDLQAFQSKTGAQGFWDASIQEAKRRAGYETLSPEEQKEFDQGPFGFAYGGVKELIWEEAGVKD